MTTFAKLAAVSAATSLGVSLGADFGRRESYTLCGHDPNKRVEYYESKKPLTKRQKRRLRGKGKS